MNENRSDGPRRRSRIDPERAGQEGFVDCARVLFSFARGRSNFIETPNWTIEPYSGVSGAANLIHHFSGRETGVYTFQLKNEPEAIFMENSHRRARQGSGVTAFSDMEHMATALAALAGKNVLMIYPLFGQKDTERFLRARGYTPTSVEAFGSRGFQPALMRTFGSQFR